MPKYTSLQIDLIEYLSQTLPKFAPAARHNNDSGYAYLQRVRNYMLGHFDGEGLDISQQFSAFAPSVKTGSGVSVKQPRFDTDDRRQLISAYDTCAENIQHMYQDRSLMQREPMLGAIMRYADLQFRLAGPEGPNTHGYYSDKVLQTITTALGQMQNIPSAAKMNELSVQDPQAYQAGVSIMNLMHAWCDYNEPEPAISSEQIDQADPQALRQDKIRKLTNLKNALQAVSDAGEDNFRKFMVATGNDDYLLQSCDLIFNPKNSANCQAAADQLGQQISLLQQGLTLQEIRLLSDFSAVVKDGKGELGGQGIKFANLFEPFRTQAMAVDELSRQCAEKLQNGFGSEQEKNDFFKRLGTEAAQFGDSLANINLNAYEKNTPELEKKANDTLGVIRKFQQSYTLKEGVLKKAADMKDRILSLEQSKKWSGRVDLSSCYSALKNAGSKYLGAKDSEEYKNYREMMKTLKDVTVLSMKKRPNEVAKTILGDKCLDVIDKGTDYLKNIFGKSAEEIQAMDPGQRAVLQDRTAGVLGVLKGFSPKNADELRAKASALFGHDVSWDEIKQRNTAGWHKKPNYGKYYELHTGENARDLPENKLAEYAAKATSALFFMDNANKKFDVSVPRKYASKIMEWPDFKAAIRAAGPQRVREVLRSGDTSRLVDMVSGGPARYAVNDQTKAKLRALSQKMQTEGRSSKWASLKNALADGNMNDSKKVFDSVETYLKGKKSVSNDPERQESVKLALDALAIVAQNGDAVAKERAQMLVDRFNAVRHAEPGSPNHIDLRNYGKEPAAGNNQINGANIQNQVNP